MDIVIRKALGTRIKVKLTELHLTHTSRFYRSDCCFGNQQLKASVKTGLQLTNGPGGLTEKINQAECLDNRSQSYNVLTYSFLTFFYIYTTHKVSPS